MTVKALTFDIIGTVFDWYGSFSAALPPLAKQYGFNLDPVAFATGAVEGYATGVATVLQGAKWTPPDDILRGSITALLSEDRVPSTAEVDAFFGIWQTLNPWSDVAHSLGVLHQRFTLAMLSNMSTATQAALTSHSGLPFDQTLSAESVRTYKPNPAVYKMATARLALRPDEIMMVAAHDYDLKAAQSEGFRTAYIARKGELGTPDASFDINVQSFNDFTERLGEFP
jgi:2-haloacid dehalogenase